MAGALAAAGCAQENDAVAAGGFRLALEEHDATAYPHPFAVVSTVRELPDGRVLVADALSQVLVALNIDAGAADTVGRVGPGPAEYRQPDAVWPLPGGRTLLVDLGNGRLTDLGPDLEFGDTRPYASGDPTQGEMVIAIPQGVDNAGRIYFRSQNSGLRGPRDSASILRMELETGEIDTVGRIGLPATSRVVSGDADNQSVTISPIPLAPADAWGVGADGRVVVARAADYRVEWIEADGAITSGAPQPYDPVDIGEAEKAEWRENRSEIGGGLGTRAEVVNGSVSITAERGIDRGGDDDDPDRFDWPATKPAFYGRPIPVDPAGRAWVRRHLQAGSPTRYDVFDSSGAYAGSVILPLGRRVVSFGENAVYVVRLDALGLQHLERYPRPAVTAG